MILYYIEYQEDYEAETPMPIYATNYRIYFPTKEKAETAWKKQIRDAKEYNKFPMSWQVKSLNTTTTIISKDEITYNAPKYSHELVKEDIHWFMYRLVIKKPQKLDLGKNNKEMAFILTRESKSFFNS
jgi:hypothetical protein